MSILEQPEVVRYKPRGSHCVVRLRELESKGLIILPGREETSSCSGTVITRGPAADEVQPGDRVVFAGPGTYTWQEESGTYSLVPEREILCVVESFD